MRARSHPAICLLAVLASACTWSDREGPVVIGVAPSRATDLLDVELRISGTGFEPDVQVDFDRPGDSTLDTGLGVALVSPAGRIALVDVVRLSSTELRATLRAGAAPGTYDVAVRAAGREATAPSALEIFPGDLAVTTAADEGDAGATPASPGGTGLSLREAVAWVNGTGTGRAITLAAPLEISMLGPQTGLTLSPPGAALVGEPGVAIDFGGNKQSCITLDGPGQRLVGLTLRACEGAFVTLATGSGGSQVAQVTTVVTNPGKQYWAYGIDARSTSSAPSLIGPGNDLSLLWVALKLDGAHYEVFGNRVHGNALGAKITAPFTRLWQNTFSGGVVGPSLVGIGVDISNGPGPVLIANNVFDGNAGGGLVAAAVASLTVRNNLFTGNGEVGLDAQAAGLTHDHNGYFGNVAGDVSANLATGLTDLLADPLYVDAPGGDYRLLPGSPAVDEGIDVGIDLNGASPGFFSGLAPDLGAAELE